MDSLISAALSVICSQGVNGILVTDLWPRLRDDILSSGLQLCGSSKIAVWKELMKIPGLELKIGESIMESEKHCWIQSFEEAENKSLKIVAGEHLRDSFLGLYDLKVADAGISPPQRRVLERLAVAGSTGITQSQLAKEFGMKGNNFFYVVRKLECEGLITRQSTIVRRKEDEADGRSESKNISIVNTNLMYLSRYAKPLSSQQRIEITKTNTRANDRNDINYEARDCANDDVLIQDYLPALKAVCDKLEKAKGKVLVIYDIKKELGYHNSAGHKAWRNILKRLTDAGLVEKIHARAPEKVEDCLRLLKNFHPKHFQPKSVAFAVDDLDTDQPIRYGKRGQLTEQLLELPIECQVYDMISAEGTKGLTVNEVCKRLGLNNKRYYTRLLNMFSRFGLHLQAETRNRSMLYRVWTPGNFNAGLSIAISRKQATTLESDFRTSEEEYATPGSIENKRMRHDLPRNSLIHGEINDVLSYGSNQCEVGGKARVNDAIFDRVGPVIETNIVPSKITPIRALGASKSSSSTPHPCTLTAPTAERQQKILEHLQEVKFVLFGELRKWYESLDQDKHTKVDRTSLVRTVEKLQSEGHCKYVDVSVPVLTNCRGIRNMKVVMHNSIQSLPPDFHERVRAFDMKSRGKGLARLKEKAAVPVLSGITRTSNPISSDYQGIRADKMRTGGFVLAKMVGSKLLHTFLWGYVCNSPDWNCALSFGRHGYELKNPENTCNKFVLDGALKAMPLELFVQLVGSSQNFTLVENCKRGLSLSDLPDTQYKSLMDTSATVRLSLIVDILRRLKLIRIVTDGQIVNSDATSITTLTHVMELKPYIEEPLSFGVCTNDLRPRIRHDFILSSKEAVDAYWNTLEYLYATTDRTCAIHAFPGSSVHEVCNFKSWGSTQVITVEERTLMLKSIVTEDAGRKISFADCVKISGEYNLTLGQVLRVFDDKQPRLRSSQRDFNSKEHAFQPLIHCYRTASRKRRRTSKACSSKRIRAGGKDTEENYHIRSYSSYDDCHIQAHEEDRHATHTDELGENEEHREGCGLINPCSISNPSRSPFFLWTESSKRQLLIAYARHCAALGANRILLWHSIPDLPAPPDTCKRKMVNLKRNPVVREAILKFCTLLGERYAKHLQTFQEKATDSNDLMQVVQTSSAKELVRECPESYSEDKKWDDFDDKVLKLALDKLLRCTRMAKLNRRAQSSLGHERVDKNLDTKASDSQELDFGTSTANSEGIQNSGGNRKRQRGPCSHRLPAKFLKCLNKGNSVSRRAYESLAVANAVELLKVICLNTVTSPELPKLLAKTVRRYSEHDLFVAYNYLRDKKFLAGGDGTQPFSLSRNFLHIISSSPFPINTGKRAAKFASWLCEREHALMEEELYADFQCGDTLHLLALVLTGEFFICPKLPDEGIGEAEEKRRVKSKSDDDKLCSGDQASKKPMTFLVNDGEFVSRREKGFPGIKVSLCRVTVSKGDTMDMLKNGNNGTNYSLHDENYEMICLTLGGSDSFPLMNQLKPSNNLCSTTVILNTADESQWNTIIRYSECVTSSLSEKEQVGPLSPDLFKSVYSTIRKSGHQGLRMEDVFQIVEVQGTKVVEHVVDVLQLFGLVMKVNAYNHVHVVDCSFRSKYFLSSVDGCCQDLESSPHVNSPSISDKNHATQPKENRTMAETSMDAVHKVTILNLPEEPQFSDVPQHPKGDARCELTLEVEPIEDRERENLQSMISNNSHSIWPILPWINGDGTTNPVVYKGLTRRVLGIVMQNPAILEDDIIHKMPVLNPQNCRKLLELMILDNHLMVRKMYQATSGGPPTILKSLFGSKFKKPQSLYREHFFANPSRTFLL